MCRNIPTTIAKMISKFSDATNDSESNPVINPNGVVTANTTMSNQMVLFLIFDATNKVINAMETGIWWKMIPINRVFPDPWWWVVASSYPVNGAASGIPSRNEWIPKAIRIPQGIFPSWWW